MNEDLEHDDDVGGDEPSLGTGATRRRVGRPEGARFKPAVPERRAAAERDTPHDAGGKRLTRTRKRTTSAIDIDRSIIPDHMDYEWKTESCYGDPAQQHVQNIKENHWTPVPADRHPGVAVRQGGLVLYERPKYLTEEARQEDYDVARQQAHIAGLKLGETPRGQLTRDHPSVRKQSSLNREFAPINVPTD